jgi:hypothetical protein
MFRITRAQVLSLLGFVVLCGVWTMIDRVYGQREAFRFWGVTLVAVSVVLTFMRRIPITVGNTELKPLEGWRKAYVLVPSYAIGVAVSLFPHEIACGVNLRGYVCGAV